MCFDAEVKRLHYGQDGSEAWVCMSIQLHSFSNFFCLYVLTYKFGEQPQLHQETVND